MAEDSRAPGNAADRRRSFAELARLARSGDAAAAASLRRWNPWPESSGVDRRRRAWRTPLERVSDLRVATVGPRAGRSSRLIGATDETLFLAVRGGIAVDATSLEMRWSAGFDPRHSSATALVGDDLVVAVGEHPRSRIVRLDGSSGKVLAEASLEGQYPRPGLATRGEQGTLAVLVDPGNTDVMDLGKVHRLGLELGERFGTVLWRRKGPAAGQGDFAPDPTEAGELAYREFQARGPRAAAAASPKSLSCFGADDGGVCFMYKEETWLSTWLPHQIAENDAQGRERWKLDGRRVLYDQLAMADELVVLARATGEPITSPQEVLAVERATGKIRWSLGTAPPESSIAICGDVVYVARVEASGVTVHGLELATGKPLFESRVPAELQKTVTVR
jgi:outer membrane protein assembly factor BamB